MKLYDKLKNFHNMDVDEFNDTNLMNKFEDIAMTILYDGYIQVRNDYRIYIKTVEFYFHPEEDSPIRNTIDPDPIVYHRDYRKGMFPCRKLPYFPLMTLHAHVSGLDITFENENLKYRASALIRAYAIYDMSTKSFIKTKKKYKKGEAPYDDRSTYLYDFINGFSLIEGNKNNIVWIDKATDVPHNALKTSSRENVYKYDYEYKGKRDVEIMEMKKPKEKDIRQWRFTRTNEICAK